MSFGCKIEFSRTGKKEYELTFLFSDSETKKIENIVRVVFGPISTSYNVTGENIGDNEERLIYSMVEKYKRVIDFISYYEKNGLKNLQIKKIDFREEKSIFAKYYEDKKGNRKKILGQIDIRFAFTDYKMDFNFSNSMLENGEEIKLTASETLGIYLNEFKKEEFPFIDDITSHLLKKQRIRKLLFTQSLQ